MGKKGHSSKIVVISPCFNEEESIAEFIKRVHKVSSELEKYRLVLLLVDDGSSDMSCNIINSYKTRLHEEFEIILIQNMVNKGHQQSIYNGINYSLLNLKPNFLIIMDCDGEDNPETIKEFIKHRTHDIVLAKRIKRNEGLIFRFNYSLYKSLTFIVLGRRIDFGNFSMISIDLAQQLVCDGFVHYAAYLSKFRTRVKYIQTRRTPRIAGSSKMNYDTLILHGLKVFIEYSEEVLLFYFKAATGLGLIILVLIIHVILLKLSGNATPGWSSNLISSLINSFLITSSTFLLGLLITKERFRIKGPSANVHHVL